MGKFIANQVLGMKWLNTLVGNLLGTLGLDTTSRIGGSIQFFLYDVIKIAVLLCVLIYLISYIQSYLSPERSKKIMGRFHGTWANCIAALLGTVTLLCSCSSIPLFIGFTNAGLPLGVAFSLLISSPMVDLGSLALLMSIFGAKVAILYTVLGLVIVATGDTLIKKLHIENQAEEFIRRASVVSIASPMLTQKKRLVYVRDQVAETFKRVFPYILTGADTGAVIYDQVPESWVVVVLGSHNPFGVILATIIGIPMYISIFGAIPIVEASLGKGAQLDTVLAFMTGVTTLSLPSMIMLRKAVKPKLLGVSIVTCATGIIVVGYLFNLFQDIILQFGGTIMSIFGFGKKKEEQKQSYYCGGNCMPETTQAAEAEKKEPGIKTLGGGCAKCNALEVETEEALQELGMDATIDHVWDSEKIVAYRVMTTPALVVDGQVVSYGKVLKKDEAISTSEKVRA